MHRTTATDRPLKRGDAVELKSSGAKGVVRLKQKEEGYIIHLIAWENSSMLPSFHHRSELLFRG